MDKFKKTIGARLVILAAAVVMALAGISALPAEEKTEHGYLGVTVQNLDGAEREKLGVTHGVEVDEVEKDSAAAKAGIKEGDVIQLVNGEKIRDPQDLVDVIGELAPGAATKIGLWRDGKSLEVTVALGKREHREKFAWKGRELPRFLPAGGYLGIVLQELNADLAAYFNVRSGEGVLIVRIEKDTPAEKAGLKAGDVIVKMAEKTIQDVATLHEALAGVKKGDTVAITVIRHGKRETFKAEPDFSRRQRIFRFFRRGSDLGKERLEIPDLDIDIPPLPDMSHVEEALFHVHEKLDRAKAKIEKKLERISESFWI